MYIYCNEDYNETGSESINSQAYHLICSLKYTDKGSSNISSRFLGDYKLLLPVTSSHGGFS